MIFWSSLCPKKKLKEGRVGVRESDSSAPPPVKVTKEDLQRVLKTPNRPETQDGIRTNYWLWAGAMRGAPELKKEADSSSAFPQALRKGVKESKACSLKSIRFIEEAAEKLSPSVYKAVLIRQGLGNFRDGYFYTNDALKYAADNKVFEGKKMFINHPSAIDEQSRPERDVKDIAGQFSNVSFETDEDGRGMLVGEVAVLPGQNYDWVRSVFNHDLDFKSQHPDKEFVGLSINANGSADPVDLEEFMSESKLPDSVKSKLKDAKDKGIETIKVVSEITDAESCDLVTAAGAGGEVIKLL